MVDFYWKIASCSADQSIRPFEEGDVRPVLFVAMHSMKGFLGGLLACQFVVQELSPCVRCML